MERTRINNDLGRERLANNKGTVMVFLGVPIPTPDNRYELPEIDELIRVARKNDIDKNPQIAARSMTNWKIRARITLQRFWNNLQDPTKPGHTAAKEMVKEAMQTNLDLKDLANVRKILDHYEVPNEDESEVFKKRAEEKKRSKGLIFEDPTAIPQPNTDPARFNEISGTQFADHLLELRKQRLGEEPIPVRFIGTLSAAVDSDTSLERPLPNVGTGVNSRITR